MRQVAIKRNEKYTQNPFVDGVLSEIKTKRKVLSNGSAKHMVIEQETGEVVSTGASGFWITQEVDRAQFIKLYVGGVKAFKELTQSGAKVFELMYLQVQEQISQDKIYLSQIAAAELGISKATYFRGLGELIEKGFLAQSIEVNRYFINPEFIFNGDRLQLVKEYRVRNSSVKISSTEALEALGQTRLIE